MKIKVTQQDIDNGERELCAYCPIALAVKRTMDTEDVGVYSEGTIEAKDTIFKLPRKAYKFMQRFDSGGEVKPFSFDLTL